MGLNGRGKLLTEFDVFSRLYLNQFNLLSRLENFNVIKAAVRRGVIEGVSIVPPIRHADGDISYRHTLFIQRKASATEDTFPSIKAMRNRQIIVPPTTTAPATAAPVPSPTTPS